MSINCQIHENLKDCLRTKSINSNLEVCGFILNNEFVECKNIHPDPKNYFLISPKDIPWDKLDDNTLLFHSHPEHATVDGFSKWDIENQFYFQLKMLLYSVKYNRFYFRDL